MEQVIEQPIADGSAQQTETVEAPLSLKEHATAFAPPGKDETAEQIDARHHSAEQRREKTGEFKSGKVRHRAASQQASVEDAPRIQALTAARRTAEERVTALEAEVTRLKTVQAPRAQIAQAEQRVEHASAHASPRSASGFAEPEPVEDDPTFDGDYGKYLRAVSGWEGRKAYHEAKHREAQQAQQQTALHSFGARIDAAKAKHADFEAVAFAPSRIPEGSVIDAWIMDDDLGPDVLYHLQKHPQELDSLLRMSVLQQAKHLALLSQRLLPPSQAQAGTTGSAAPRSSIITLPPRPPNPVRTEAQRTGASSPPTDGTLSVMGHAKAFKRS